MRPTIANSLFLISMALPGADAARAQNKLDRADPITNQRTLPDVEPASAPPVVPSISSRPDHTAVSPMGTITPTAISVVGSTEIPPTAFSDIIVMNVGRPLTREDLAKVASDVAAVAHRRGFPLATATIPPQPLSLGVLKINLNEGRIDAVRVIGAINPAADRLLVEHLATGQPTRQADLERAILLVGDLPGVTVTSSNLVQQGGFGILLVTIKQETFSAYALVDNRGSREIGPIRSTMLANIRNVAHSGDELGLILSSIPLQQSEFGFARGRYTMPIGGDGLRMGLSASYGRSQPGASLKPLDVQGESWEGALTVSMPLQRSRARNLALNVELRTLKTQLDLASRTIRHDRLSTLSASIEGVHRIAGGVLTSQLVATAGLPLAGMSQQGDTLLSRIDGDARFATMSYMSEWTRPVTRQISVALASTGQLASRPLLAAMEIGAGGPLFGRAYDFAERTGDMGILGLAELRFNVAPLLPVFDNLQLYGSVDGGHVTNLRGGRGGGGLLSNSIGVRATKGKLNGMVEIALPLNADRFDTRDRDPRISFRIARRF